MALNLRTVVTSTGTTQIGTAKRNRHQPTWSGSVWVYGTWGGTTATFQSSPNGGTTRVDLKDQSGSARSSTANDTFNVELTTGANNGQEIPLYITLTGGTGISLTVDVYDNEQ